MSDDLKPCPFCGSSNIKGGGDDKVVGYWCLNCEAVGPNQYGSHEWNNRADRIEELEAKLAEANKVSTNVRRWYYFPIEMPLSEDDQGPATLGVDAVKMSYEVWDALLNTHGTFNNLPDAINEAMRLNNLAELKGETE